MELRPVPVIVDDGSPEGTDYEAPRHGVLHLPAGLLGWPNAPTARGAPRQLMAKTLRADVVVAEGNQAPLAGPAARSS